MSSTTNQPTFETLLSQKQWTDYNAFVSEAPKLYASEIAQHVAGETELIRRLKEHELFKRLTVKDVAPNLEKAEELLNSGKVIAVDGTRSTYRTYSGMRCQIGVVAVNYSGDQIKRSFFISEAGFQKPIDDIIQAVARRNTADDQISEMVVRALMLYREREAGMDDKFRDSFVMFHGPLLPFELLTGLGRWRALDKTLDVLERIIREKRFFSVISTTAYQDYLTFGRAIERGQYLTASNYTLGHHIADNRDFMARDKWRDDEFEKMQRFLRNYAEQISIGVIRVSERPYVFHAHKDSFDLAAAIIARDAMHQREKGFPLLIDYADTLCSRYFSTGDFNSMMEFELARNGEYLSEVPERRLRLK
jgi:hypothetical protein